MASVKLRDLPLGVYGKSICFNQTWEEKLKLIKDSGYDFFEIAIDNSPERMKLLFDKQERNKVRAAIEKTGVPIYTLAFTVNRYFPLGSEDDEIRNKGIELVKKAVECANYIGIRIIHIAAYDVYQKPGNIMTAALFRQSIENILEYAAMRGVIIAFETMDSTFMDQTKKIMAFVRAMDSPYLQAVADIGNLTAMGTNPITDMPIGGRHLVAIHIKDTRPGQVRDVFFGSGTVDFDGCFKTLHDMNYTGFLVAEMWSHEDPEYHQNIITAAKFLKEKMKDY